LHPLPCKLETMQRPIRQSLIVDAGRQEVALFENGLQVAAWPVSTSKFGLGTEEGSFKTPTGEFLVAEKIGAGCPAWSIFKSRVPTGETASPGGDEDLVLTRILWLEGTGPDNTNTRGRYIYFHGTNQEHLIGTPASHGCIRLRNDDMIALFDRVAEGTPVEIHAPGA